MKIVRTILALILCAWSLAAWSQDFTRMSERSLMGTARYVGMAGAMTAVGGDPSAAFDNPAGTGLYRRAEVLIGLESAFDYTHPLNTATKTQRNSFMLHHGSVVFSLPTSQDGSGVQFHNFLFAYQRVQNYQRSIAATSGADRSLGALLNTPTINWDIPFCADKYNTAHALNLKEYGSVNAFAFDWSMNIADRWYTGLGLRIHSYSLSANAEYTEQFAKTDVLGAPYTNVNRTSVLFSGVGWSMAGGVIYRPAGWIRLGLGVQTPTIGSFRTYTTGTFVAKTDSVRYSYAPDARSEDKGFHMPLNLSSSVAFQIGAYAMIALQYDYRHASFMDDIHILKAGVEVIPVLGLYLNAGYACESTFKNQQKTVPMDETFVRQDTYFHQSQWSQYASFAVGYRGTHLMVQAAYQYRWQRFKLYAHENATPYDIAADTHRVVLTFGWHRN